MKLRKKPKKIIASLIILLAVVAVGAGVYFMFFKSDGVKSAKVLSKIEKYGYVLKDNKSKAYQKLFADLSKILKEDSVDGEKYASKISEMFIVDFYSLNDKTAKTDVGGVDFIYPSILDDFLENAENTFYKYVESNIYNNRKQKLPTVDTVTINSIEKTTYEYLEKEDTEAYEVKVSWTYTDESYDDYQKEATLIFIHDDIKLHLVELK